ncbi:MAG: ABC transporter ATP-binding protein [Leptospiraceae bacterium]|nr:ABC transporter ATP-binding protein [Leptospiraceae bacterium]MCK6382582.1 ABC transporter ATP-binding protein [Leptospiraceae bacterium]NUM42460.1 ABC transporter ATP-binding protein [Leptospiraceae bacterium]
MIVIKNLSKTFNGNKVISDFSLAIEENRITALVGPNGSGKTTLLKCILGLTFPDPNSSIEKDGIKISSIEEEVHKEIGYMPQTPNFPKNLKVTEILDIFKRIDSAPPDYMLELMGDLEIWKFENKLFGELSGGMKQKINILQCFGFRKKLYIADEPTSSLDPHMSYFLKSLLKKRKESGASIIFTSHIMSEVQEIAEKVCLLVDGRLVLHETPSNILSMNNASNLEEAMRMYWEKRK